jgi:hypothetical protein
MRQRRSTHSERATGSGAGRERDEWHSRRAAWERVDAAGNAHAASQSAGRSARPRSSVAELTARVRRGLLPSLRLETPSPHDPVVVRHCPEPWQVVGSGNYAAVLCHPDHPALVVKVYAPGRPGFEAEVEVYRRLGKHTGYSECLYAADGFLVLKRLHGVTLYDCVHRGIPIPDQAIRDIDEALRYARSRGLHPHDVHGRNVMLQDGRGVVADVSDFLKTDDCAKWEDLTAAFDRVYRPLLRTLRLRVPYVLLDLLRACYRVFRRVVPRRT